MDAGARSSFIRASSSRGKRIRMEFTGLPYYDDVDFLHGGSNNGVQSDMDPLARTNEGLEIALDKKKNDFNDIKRINKTLRRRIRLLESVAEGFGISLGHMSSEPYSAAWLAILQNVPWKIVKTFTAKQVLKVFKARGFDVCTDDMPILVRNVFNGNAFMNEPKDTACNFRITLEKHIDIFKRDGYTDVFEVLRGHYIPDILMRDAIRRIEAEELIDYTVDDLMNLFSSKPEIGVAIYCSLHPNQPMNPSAKIKPPLSRKFKRVRKAVQRLHKDKRGPRASRKRRFKKISRAAE